ncbi:MAG TPA: ABC transporter permease [Pirellulales bacterium]|jgi:putative ABC transport system permease protein|nr:ABC transporter permease [Pirellulales bacterium]
MSLWKIAWRSIQQRSLASSLTAVSMGLGVMMVVAVLVAGSVVHNSFATGNQLGFNVVVGAKGGRLDLLINSVYYLSRPIENIPWSYYKEFLPASAHKDRKPGKYAGYVLEDDPDPNTAGLAIPICLGDFLGDEKASFRVVGAPPEMFTKLLNSKFQPGGEVYKTGDFATAVVGAEVAKHLHLKVGGDVVPMHGGVGGEKHMPFKITGILERTGTPVDRAAFVNIEGFFLIPDHAKGHVEPVLKPGEKEQMLTTPVPEEQRECTAILLRTASVDGAPRSLTALTLVPTINKENVAQAIQPVQEISVLLNTFVRPVELITEVLALLVVLVAGIGILVSIYNSMSERRHEIAVMRALGARRNTVMTVVLFESILLALGGGLMGWLAGHFLIGVAGPYITDYTGVQVGFLQFSPTFELILIPALIALASLVGFLPALSAYRTDVGKALTATP